MPAAPLNAGGGVRTRQESEGGQAAAGLGVRAHPGYRTVDMSSGHLSSNKCPVCAGPPRELGTTEGGWDTLVCDACGHTFVRDYPTNEELTAHYASYAYENNDLSTLEPFLQGILEDVVRSFEPFRRTGRLLDVGFGAGGLLSVAKAHGWETWGVETAEAAVTKGREHQLGHLVRGDFATLELDDGTFDVVVMSELIEHLPEPAPFLERAARVLRPGGLLYTTTPHGRGLSGRVLGAGWSVLRPPDHLHLFSVASLRRSLERAGFSDVNVYTQGLLPHELLAHAKAKVTGSLSLRAATPGKLPDRTVKAYAVNRALTSRRAGKAIKSTVNALLRTTKLGDSLRGYAVR